MSKDTLAFLTGSYAYGTPSPDSDIDMVLLCSDNDAAFLFANNETVGGTIRFGKLNVVVFTNKGNFERWRDVTATLVAQKPVTREFAIEAFKNANFIDYGKETHKFAGTEDIPACDLIEESLI